MDVKTWTTVSRLLDDALDVPPGARAAWIDGLDTEYDALKPQLRELLAQAASMDSAAFLATLPKLATAGEVHAAEGGASEEGSRAGSAVGPYRLVRVLASGGQGSVWLAERPDGLVNRPVALKLPHGLAFRPGLAERMARERDILATLNHPHIARLYDAGVTVEGEPYLALEYVDGTALDRHCADRGLSVPDRVRLFLQVVRAVAYAHGQLVIHRDLKPTNILVTDEGYVRLLDFGIAKLLATDAPVDSTLTADAGRALTLPYASPEQVLQQPLGVATDVYSLGVVLYELLTGVRPHRPERDSAAALEDAILNADAKRPSDVAPSPAARKAITGDLDTIVLKALKKAPLERYATAEALADDLERALDGRPVLAQADSRIYRVRKFVGRHRVGVAASVALVVALVGGLIGTATGLMRAQRAEATARAERDAALVQQSRAEASNGFLQSMLIQADPGRPLNATELLDRGTKQLDQAEGMDESTLAYLRYSISKHYLRFSQTGPELALLEQSANGARRVGDFDLLAAAECGAAWSIGLSDAAAATTHLTAGEAAIARVSAPSFHASNSCLLARSRVLDMQGRPEAAIQLLEVRVPLLPPAPPSEWAALGVLRVQRAALYRRVGRFKDALRLSEENLADVRRRGQGGTLEEFTMLNNVAAQLGRVGEVRASLAIYRDLLGWLDRGGFAVPPLAVRSNAGLAELQAGNPLEAVRLARVARADSERAGNRAGVAFADLLEARGLVALGRIGESRARLDATETFWKKNRQGNDQQLLETSLVRANILAAEGHVSDARDSVAALLASLGYPGRKTSPRLERVLALSARLSLLAGQETVAADHASDALALARSVARDERKSADVGEFALLRAQACQAIGRHADALADAQLATDALGESLGPDHAMTEQAKALVAALRSQAVAPR